MAAAVSSCDGTAYSAVSGVLGFVATPPMGGASSHGIGVGYKLPHDYEGADVDQQYLPDELVERRCYDPTDEGWEARIRARRDELASSREQGSRKRRRN